MKNYLKITLTAIAFLFITTTASAQTINTNTSKTLWSLYGVQKLTMDGDSACSMEFRNQQYRAITDWGYLYFHEYEDMKTFFTKLKEMAELPKPKGDDTYTMKFGDISVMRGKNMFGVPTFIITKGIKYFIWDNLKNNQVLSKI